MCTPRALSRSGAGVHRHETVTEIQQHVQGMAESPVSPFWLVESSQLIQLATVAGRALARGPQRVLGSGPDRGRDPIEGDEREETPHDRSHGGRPHATGSGLRIQMPQASGGADRSGERAMAEQPQTGQITPQLDDRDAYLDQFEHPVEYMACPIGVTSVFEHDCYRNPGFTDPSQ